MDANRKLEDLALSDTGFVFDPYSGATFSTNPAGLAILRGLKDGLARADLVEALREQFDTSGADLERDVDEFMQLLRKHHVLPQEFRL